MSQVSTATSPANAAPPAGVPYIVVQAPPPPKGGGILRRLLGGMLLSVFVLSLLANFYLAGIVGALTSGPHESLHSKGDEKQRIVIIPIEGIITGATEEFADSAFDSIDARKDNLPRAVILRVDSPGGHVGPSDRILHRIEKFKKDHPAIPVVGSFGSVAASGGYYVSAACDHIVAEPTCTTGSIGVILTAMTYGKLMEKIGVDAKVIVADGSPKKDVANNAYRPLTDEDEAKLKQILNSAYEQFVAVVVRGRAKALLTEAQVRALANGDIFSARQAVVNKLIDGEGYLDAAIDQAKTLAKITGDPLVTRIEPPRGFLTQFMGASASAASPLPKSGEELRNWLREATLPRLEYLWEPGR
jgi:protease-4